MKYIVDSQKSVDQATEAFQQSAARNQYGVLHIHDLTETLREKGHPIDRECRILEVCNPQQAVRVLGVDMTMNMALPCRVSVYEDEGTTRIGMIRPAAMLGMLSDSEDLRNVATQVEADLIRMIDEAK